MAVIPSSSGLLTSQLGYHSPYILFKVRCFCSKQLLRHPNCDVTNPDDDGITALTFCSKYVRIKNDKHAIRLRSLLEYSQVDTNAQASEGSTALHVACKAGGQPDVAVQLLRSNERCDEYRLAS